MYIEMQALSRKMLNRQHCLAAVHSAVVPLTRWRQKRIRDTPTSKKRPLQSASCFLVRALNNLRLSRRMHAMALPYACAWFLVQTQQVARI